MVWDAVWVTVTTTKELKEQALKSFIPLLQQKLDETASYLKLIYSYISVMECP